MEEYGNTEGLMEELAHINIFLKNRIEERIVKKMVKKSGNKYKKEELEHPTVFTGGW